MTDEIFDLLLLPSLSLANIACCLNCCQTSAACNQQHTEMADAIVVETLDEPSVSKLSSLQ